MSNTRILVVGYGRAGKDASAFLLGAITGLPYAGSTSWAAKELMAQKLKVHPQIAWETRHLHRELWKSTLDAVRESDQTLLIRLALASVNEDKSAGLIAGWRGIVAGVRDRKELLAAKAEKLFHHIIWVHRPGTPVDPTVTFEDFDCTSVIVNDGDLNQLRWKLFAWAEKHGLVPGLYLSGKCPTTDIHRE